MSMTFMANAQIMAAPRNSVGHLHYQKIDLDARLAGASPHQLVVLLFDELLSTLAVAELAAIRASETIFETKRSRALSILMALEASLDFARGGDLAINLSRIYRETARRIRYVDVTAAPPALREAQDLIGEIAGAWNRIAQ